MLRSTGAKRALLLQGPVGPFFRAFADDLLQQGVQVTKVNFNAGDGWFFRGPEVVSFRDKMETWPEFFSALIEQREIDAIFVFGDCRPMHREAIRIAKKHGVAVWVFEEGYLRPVYITIERTGVNGNSSMSKDPEFYRRAAKTMPELAQPVSVGNTFGQHAKWAMLNSIAVTFMWWRYPHYRHHRNVNTFVQSWCWARGLARKIYYKWTERHVMGRCTDDWSGKYFFVPLQVYCDAQILHSPYRSVEQFMEDVVASFAKHAPSDTTLVLKHHPQDRAYRNYSRLVRTLARAHACADRVVYIHDLHLPTLLKNARGVITMNSTVGTSALHHHAPVKVLGDAVYDIAGMTCQRGLDEFFVDQGGIDLELFDSFCRWLRDTNQINGSYYKHVPGLLFDVQPVLPSSPAPRTALPDLPKSRVVAKTAVVSKSVVIHDEV